jgi:general secretion pathway protein H
MDHQGWMTAADNQVQDPSGPPEGAKRGIGARRAKLRRPDSRGFTLIELLIVVMLIAIVSVVVLPQVSSFFKISLNSTVRRLASVVKETYNSAVITGKVHRIVYDFKERSYWVESGPATLLLDTTESKEREQRRKRFAKDSDEPPPSNFKLERAVTRKKVELPRGVNFAEVYSEQSPDPIREGLAYTHFFPHGLTEQTLIHLQDSSNHKVSLVINPISGRSRLMDGHVTREEAYGQ